MSLLILGSVALDTIETERGQVHECLGGSASHASLAASYFHRPSMVGVVGDDFPQEYVDFLAERVDLSELKTLPGKTFRWHGFHSLTSGETISRDTQLNTYEQFDPVLSERTASAPYVLLGNISPDLQMRVLDQLRSPHVVACDTMSLWITLNPQGVVDVMRRVDLFFINEQESFELTGEGDAFAAGQALLQLGAKRAIIKRGERPALLVWEDEHRLVPGVPDVDVVDPTGAGDNFAGALMGYLAQCRAAVQETDRLLEGMRRGAAVASYAIEAFGTLAHRTLTLEQIEKRLDTPAEVR